jgi:hypothetical protein
MNRILYTLLLIILFFGWNAAYSQIAVIPYKIKNPSDSFSPLRGEEYARLLSVAMLIKKNVEVASPRDVIIDLRRFSLNPQGVITRDDLQILGKGGYIEYFLLGAVSRIGDSYISDSRLYSVRENSVTISNRSRAGNLFDLAERDIGEMCLQFPDRPRPNLSGSSVDISVVADLSYNVSREWPSVKSGIGNFVDTLSDNWYIDSRVYIIPFSDFYTVEKSILYVNSPMGLKRELGRLRPRGGNRVKFLERALSYSVRNISWRRNSSKILLIITNSPLGSEHFVERHIIAAKGLGIRIFTLSLGNLNWRDTSRVKQLSIMGRGLHFSATYHQRLFDLKGKGIDLLIEAGRLFKSMGFGDWRGGILGYSSKRADYSRVDSTLDEILYDERKYDINPYNLTRYYTELTGEGIMNHGVVENNIDATLGRIGESYFGSGAKRMGRKIGRALISDGKITFWMNIMNKRDLDYFEKKLSHRFFHPIGISLQKSSDEPYGIALYPTILPVDITGDYVPEMIKTDLESLIKKPDYYMENGLFHPPIWFISIKVERIKRDRRVHDIRE